jgi:4a-hydroxytetrahydrobiopterin dehydratase
VLREEKCVPCQGGVAPLSEAEILALQPQAPGWQVVEREAIRRLERVFKFTNFQEALAFTIQVGRLAEAEDHHPAILTEWGKVTVTWWTHTLRGLHRNDFIMAAKTDALFETPS